MALKATSAGTPAGTPAETPVVKPADPLSQPNLPSQSGPTSLADLPSQPDRSPQSDLPSLADVVAEVAASREALGVSAPMTRSQRLRTEARFRVTQHTAEELLDNLAAAGRLGETADSALRLMVVVAHPDDEAIGAGALLRNFRNALIVHVTDGGGQSDSDAQRRGFTSRQAYARARRGEVVDALKLIGISETQIRCLGIPDGAASRRLVEACRALMDVFDEQAPDVVLSHPYEGGHTDHDASAFAVHLACGILRREGAPAPLVLELASYHMRDGQHVRGDFLPHQNVPMRAVQLSPEGQLLKARMLARFTSQRGCLSAFPVDTERFRVAPRYLFTEPPHAGMLGYESHRLAISGSEWRAEAGKALKVLRTRQQIRSRTG